MRKVELRMNEEYKYKIIKKFVFTIAIMSSIYRYQYFSFNSFFEYWSISFKYIFAKHWLL